MILIFIVLGIALFTFFTREDEPARLFPATVNRDCAPWDGAAFTVSIQYDPGRTIIISIWKSPDIPLRSTFSFPDDSGQVGNAYLAPALGQYMVLEGEVSLQGVDGDKPIEGGFRFSSERGDLFEGLFRAEWEDKVILCG